jgi:hypothetical protein
VDVGSFYTRLFEFDYVTYDDFHAGSEKIIASCIKFCANRAKRATETLTIIQQAFGNQILNHTQVFQWHSRLKTSHTSADGDEHKGKHTGCTNPETVAQIKELVRQGRHSTIHDIRGEVGIGYGTCY